jgi:two-component system nitrate/nitrite response regulator NarL
VRLGVRNLLMGDPFTVVGEASDGQDAVELTRRLRPDILLLDLAMPQLPGLEALRQLADMRPAVQVILLTAKIEKPQLLEALQRGARGILLKDSAPNDLVKAVRAVAAGQYWMGQSAVASLVEVINLLNEQEPAEQRKTFGLTPRELQIVAAVVEGRTNKDIAQKFSISEETVKRHLTNVFDKLGTSNRLELALFAINHELFPAR